MTKHASGARLPAFLHDERGAITIDWVAITSAILMLGIAVIWGIFNSGVAPASAAVAANLGSIDDVETGPSPEMNASSEPLSDSNPVDQLVALLSGDLSESFGSDFFIDEDTVLLDPPANTAHYLDSAGNLVTVTGFTTSIQQNEDGTWASETLLAEGSGTSLKTYSKYVRYGEGNQVIEWVDRNSQTIWDSEKGVQDINYGSAPPPEYDESYPGET